MGCTLRRLSLGQEGRGRPSPTAIAGSKGTWATLSTGSRWDKKAVGCPIHRLSQGQEGRGVHSQTALAGTGGRGLHSPTALAGTRRMWAVLSVGTRWDLDGEKVWAAVEERLRAVRTMAGTDWGCHRGTLRTLWIAQGQGKQTTDWRCTGMEPLRSPYSNWRSRNTEQRNNHGMCQVDKDHPVNAEADLVQVEARREARRRQPTTIICGSRRDRRRGGGRRKKGHKGRGRPPGGRWDEG